MISSTLCLLLTYISNHTVLIPSSKRQEQWRNQIMDLYFKYLSGIMCYRNITADEETRDPLTDLHVDKTWLSDLDVVTSAFLLHLKKYLALLFFFRYDHIAHVVEIAVDTKDLNNKTLGVSTSRSRNVTGRTGNCQSKAQKDSQRSKGATWNSYGKFSNLHDSLCLYDPFTSQCSYCQMWRVPSLMFRTVSRSEDVIRNSSRWRHRSQHGFVNLTCSF